LVLATLRFGLIHPHSMLFGPTKASLIGESTAEEAPDDHEKAEKSIDSYQDTSDIFLRAIVVLFRGDGIFRCILLTHHKNSSIAVISGCKRNFRDTTLKKKLEYSSNIACFS